MSDFSVSLSVIFDCLLELGNKFLYALFAESKFPVERQHGGEIAEGDGVAPYLIIGSEMRTALVNAAKSGVDVRLVVPGIPDKKLVYFLTQSNFPYLIKNGVKIYTYTPGFIHAKCFVSDDIQATVGTVNLDYRSLCLHFECGVWMYRTRAVLQVKEDALKTFAESHEVTLEEFQKKSFLVRTFMGALKLFSPLL